MHPFQQDATKHKQKRSSNKDKDRDRDRDTVLAGGPSHASSSNATVTSAGLGSRSHTSTRLPTYVDYTALNGGHTAAANNSASLPTDADDKIKKYYSISSGSIRGRIIARANSAKGWYGAALRTAVRAGVVETVFWLRAAGVVLLLILLSVRYIRPLAPHFRLPNFTLTLLHLCFPVLATIYLLIPRKLIIFMRTYEVHIELQFFSRNWIKRSIKPVPPLSGTCFAPSTLAASSYNTTLANNPKYLNLNPGISMRFGLDCYNFAKQLPSTPIQGQELPEITTYHLYWRADLAPLQDRQILLLKSIFTTQDMSSTNVILWTNDVASITKNPLLRDIRARVPLDRFSIRDADFEALARSTPMAGHHLLKRGGRDTRAWLDGDLIRVLVLYAYGGIWVDMDTLLLRSIRPLTEQEFVTQWDCYDKPYAPLNGAIMHFYKHSPYLCELLYMMATGPAPRQGTTDWGSLLYHQLHRRLLQAGQKPFTVLPYCLTDARSCRLDNRLPDPFEKDDGWIRSKAGGQELETKLDSIYSIHLHNQWHRKFPTGGWMSRLVTSKIDERWRSYQIPTPT